MEYPELAARTRRFSAGSPRAIGVADDGSRVVFLRSGGPEDLADRLHVLDLSTGAERLIADPVTLLADAGDLPPEERALRERRRLSAGGIGSYAIDRAGAVAAFTLAGRLFRADLDAGTVAEVPTAGPVVDPRPDPTCSSRARRASPGGWPSSSRPRSSTGTGGTGGRPTGARCSPRGSTRPGYPAGRCTTRPTR